MLKIIESLKCHSSANLRFSFDPVKEEENQNEAAANMDGSQEDSE